MPISFRRERNLRSAVVILILLANHTILDIGVKKLYGGQENRHSQSPHIKCIINASDLTWRTEAVSALVFVVTQCEETNGLTVMPSLHLAPLPRQSGPNHGECWARFNLTTGATTKESQVMSPTAETKTRSVRLSPTKLLWGPRRHPFGRFKISQRPYVLAGTVSA
jgi:hypothetical protein